MSIFNFAIREPSSKEDILAQLRALHQASTAFWNEFSTAEFFAPVGTGWSPAGNVRHLNKAVQPLARALRLPHFLPRILFGKPGKPSRTFGELRDSYLTTLSKGGGAGSFAPEPEVSLDKSETARSKLMTKREELSQSLLTAIERWSDGDLDRYQFPHPLLGKLTVREMLFFTLYHNYHHPQSVSRRLQTTASG
jgi:hypothetical protein